MILKKKVLSLALVAITIPVLALATCSIIFNSDNLLGLSDAVPMEINMTSSKNQLKTGTASSTPYSGSTSIQTERGNNIGIDYSNILIADGAWHTLSMGSTFKNTTALHGLSSMVITVADNSASLGIYWSKDTSFSGANSATYNSSSSKTITCDFASYNPNYFKVIGIGSESIITSIVVSFSCVNSYPSLTVISSDSSKGTVSDGGQYLVNSSVTVTATPASWYTLSGWYNNGALVSSDNPYTFTMPSTDYSLIAQFRTPIVGDNITFGSYPQSKVSDTSLISTLNTAAGTPSSPASGVTWSDYNYYISSAVTSYTWFTDITNNSIKYRGVYFTSYRPSSTSADSTISDSYQDDYGYDLSTTYWFKYEPLSWRVLAVDSGKYLLMSNSIIDSQDYYYVTSDRTIDSSTVSANNYKYSHIRSWLNGYTDVEQVTNSYSFINQAFSADEQAKINTTTVDNSAATTNDKLFLLSNADTDNSTYFSDATKRQLKTTDYCQSQGGYTASSGTYQGNGYWWLRSPYSSNSYSASYVNYYGIVDGYSIVRFTRNGVAPALWVTL